jgi:Tat protein secretion system quality control protein TatD with DNase activity
MAYNTIECLENQIKKEKKGLLHRFWGSKEDGI